MEMLIDYSHGGSDFITGMSWVPGAVCHPGAGSLAETGAPRPTHLQHPDLDHDRRCSIAGELASAMATLARRGRLSEVEDPGQRCRARW